MYSDPGDYIGQGVQRVFHDGNAQITLGGNAGRVTVAASGGNLGDRFSFEFSAPPGEELHVGVYEDAQRSAFREATRPGIDISGDGRGCNTIEGRFDVKDLAISPTGVVERAWIVYEQHCEGDVSALFGEVRVSTGAAATSSFTAPLHVRWPGVDLGAAGRTVPVTLIARGPAADVTQVAIDGEHAADFVVRSDECTGVPLAAGASCPVWVRFVPTAAGQRGARLVITDAAGTAHTVTLEGFAYGGRTQLVMESEPGDWVGAGQDWLHTPADSVIAMGGNRSYVWFAVDGPDGSWWYGDFEAPAGDILVPGTYANATRYPFNGTGPGLDVSGNGRGCNVLTGSFTVTSASFRPDGRPREFGVTFVQHCERDDPALRGTFEFRVPGEPAVPPAQQPPTTAEPPPAAASPPPAAATPQPGGPAVPAPGVHLDDPAPASPRCWGRTVPPARVEAGSGGDDHLTGSRSTDLLLGLAGNDRLDGWRGNDCLEGADGDDRLSGGAGRDRLDGGPGGDRLTGGPAADLLLGRSGRDMLSGGSGGDRMSAGSGDDVVDGGSGRDRIDCGRGQDVARVSRGDVVRNCERIIRGR